MEEPMRKPLIFLFFLVLALSLGCQPQGGAEKPAAEGAETAVTDIAAEEQAVAESLDDYMNAVELKDQAYFASVVDQGPDNVFIGTSADGWVVGWDALEEQMAARNAGLSDISINQTDLKIHVLPGAQTAWATSRWEFSATSGGQPIKLPIRCTWVFEKRKDEWEIVHFHQSVGMQ
jgi:ketosteroid isomerase-like protein